MATRRPRRGTTRPTLLLSILVLGIVNLEAFAQDVAAASSAAAAAGRAEVEVGADGASAAAGGPCNCSDSIARTESLLKNCRNDISRRLSSDDERDLRTKLSAAEADAEERAREAAKVAEKRASDAAELKVSGLKNSLKEAEGRIDAREAALGKAREELEAVRKEREAEREKITAACEAKRSESDTLKADLAAAKEQKAQADAECTQIVTNMEESLKGAAAEVEKQKKALSKCRLDLAESESDRNDAIQSLKKLQESIKMMEEDHEKKTNKLKDEIKEMKKDVDRQKRLLKASNDKFYDTRRDLHDRESELRDMHRKATSQYFNTSLLLEDTVNAADKALTHTENFASRVWSDISGFAGPHLTAAWKGVKTLYGKASNFVAPYLLTAKNHYNSSVHPYVLEAQKPIVAAFKEHAKPHTDPIWEKYVSPTLKKVSEIRTAMRLSFISAVRQSSRTIATYLLLSEEGKSNREKSPRKRRIVKALQRADKNAEGVVEQVSRWLFVSLFVLFCGEYFLLLALFILALPFRPIMYMVGWGRQNGGGNVAEKAPQLSRKTNGGKRKHRKEGGLKVENNWQAQ